LLTLVNALLTNIEQYICYIFVKDNKNTTFYFKFSLAEGQ